MAANVFVHPYERRAASHGRWLERLEDERWYGEMTDPARVHDLLHPHAIQAGGTPRLVGDGLLARQPVDTRRGARLVPRCRTIALNSRNIVNSGWRRNLAGSGLDATDPAQNEDARQSAN
jgi:hypothetical protein